MTTPPDPAGTSGARTGDEPALTLDCRGRRCPLPVIELARRIGGVDVGAVVLVVADDPAARVDLPAWCRMRGQEWLGESRAGDGTPAYSVRRRH